MSANPAISAEHKEDILHAAIAEFGRVGYGAASTNEIVKNAKVSKGLLFHYFTNKKKLYTACQLYVMEQYGKFMAKHFEFPSTDLFDRILYGLKIKMEFGRKNPEFLTITNRARYLEAEESLLTRPEAHESIAEFMQQFTTAFFDGIDTSRFREGIELAKVMDYTRLAMEASWVRFSHKHNNDIDAMVKDIDSYFKEAEEIVSLLRDGAYKNEI